MLLLPTVATLFGLQAQVIGASEDLRIGSDSAAEYSFTMIRQGVVDKTGNIYVLLPREAKVRVFSASGRFLRTLGRKGQGPGEMMWPLAMGWRADTLWVRDVELYRVNLISSTTGNPLRTILDRMPMGKGRYVSGPPAALLSDGSLLGVGDFPSTLVSNRQITSVPMMRFFEGGQEGHEIRILTLDNLYGDHPPTPTQPGVHFQQRLSDAPLWHVAHDGSAIALVDRLVSRDRAKGRYTVTIVGPAGVTLRQREIEYAPKALSRSLRESVIQQTLNQFGRSNMRLRPEVVFTPAYLPPVTELFLATDGRVWLKREFSTAPTTTWDVLNRELQPMGTVTLPTDFKMLAVDGDRIWGTRIGEVDVPFIVRYSLRYKATEGFLPVWLNGRIDNCSN